MSALELSVALTAHTQALCVGLERGEAPIFDLVTPTTASLLRWWFGAEMVAQRRTLNFHEGQRQAILNAIVAHEVLARDRDDWSLRHLYQACAPGALVQGDRSLELDEPRHSHPKYCFKMATGTGKTWVLQALMVWQLLNKTAAQQRGADDARFTRHFLVVAPGLIVYERLLDAFCGKAVQGGNGARNFASADLMQFAELFVPGDDQQAVFAFVQGNVCSKTEIGLKTTGNGMIALTNWHLLTEGAVDQNVEDVQALAPLALADAHHAVNAVLPLMPGRATGNSLEMLDRRYARGDLLEYLVGLPELMVFNDEAHHIHDFKRDGEFAEVEWQKSLRHIARNKGRRFVQVDFSATPYNVVGVAERKVFFPHIVTDFDLHRAMKLGLVKSLVLDRRKQDDMPPLDFNADRDAAGNVTLSNGQRRMLRAGVVKLKKLEADFAALDPIRRPKMLVVCEDTTVTPKVAEFLRDDLGFRYEGDAADDVLLIDSGKKAEVGDKEWALVRERLFGVDDLATPRVIVSVLMLREGFDVNNICVIVPLRASKAPILLEQTVGRGLRLMWRGDEFTETRDRNRELINSGQEPVSLIDVLTVIEHPAFQSFYDDLMAQGLAGVSGDDDEDRPATGDLISVGLRAGFKAFDFAIPFILQEADELRDHHELDLAALPAYTAQPLDRLQVLLGQGDEFVSKDLQSSTLFGDYQVGGDVMAVGGYNEYLSRLTRRISQALSEPLPTGRKVATHLAKPYLQVNTADLTGWLDDYIWTRLFGATFNPLEADNWRVLLLQPVVTHIVSVFALALLTAENRHVLGGNEVHLRWLSEVSTLVMSENLSQEVSKSIYTRLGWPARSGGLERKLIHWAQVDAKVQAFCKISEYRHTFARLRYVCDDGRAAFYSPDFLVRTSDTTYLVETKAQNQMANPDVLRKRIAALAWCERINALSESERGGPPWHYALLGEADVDGWYNGNAHLADLLDFVRLRPLPGAHLQSGLF